MLIQQILRSFKNLCARSATVYACSSLIYARSRNDV